jgi:hypothetical protein
MEPPFSNRLSLSFIGITQIMLKGKGRKTQGDWEEKKSQGR